MQGKLVGHLAVLCGLLLAVAWTTRNTKRAEPVWLAFLLAVVLAWLVTRPEHD